MGLSLLQFIQRKACTTICPIVVQTGADAPTGKVRGSLVSLRFILRAPWMSVQIVMEIWSIVVEHYNLVLWINFLFNWLNQSRMDSPTSILPPEQLCDVARIVCSQGGDSTFKEKLKHRVWPSPSTPLLSRLRNRQGPRPVPECPLRASEALLAPLDHWTAGACYAYRNTYTHTQMTQISTNSFQK